MQERSSSIRLRRRRGEEGRQEFLKSRRSGEWAHRFLNSSFLRLFVMGASILGCSDDLGGL